MADTSPNKLLSCEWLLPDLAATRALGAHFARLLQTGDALLLEGGLGAGKTELARAIIQARLAAPVEVPSPTFTLTQTYHADNIMLTHADLYRLQSHRELTELGLDEALESGVLLVEWPDRAMNAWPETALRLHLTIQGDGPGRRLCATGSLTWGSRLEPLRGISTQARQL